MHLLIRTRYADFLGRKIQRREILPARFA
jgi:hypothetical protein